MIRRPPRSTRTYTLCPFTTLFRSLPVELMVAFPNPQDLRIKHVTAIKPLLKPDDRRQRVFAEAAALSARSGGEGAPVAVPDIVRALALAADPPKRSGSPKKSGMAQVVDRKSTRLNSSH